MTNFVVALCLLLPPVAGPDTAGAPFLAGLVQSEEGFDGAVEVVDVAEDGPFGIATVNVPYRDVHGAPKMGQARLVVQRSDVEEGPVPALCHVHYEMDVNGAKKWCKPGWAVTTAHYGGGEGEYPIELFVGNSYNLSRAIIQWVRRLPFIDRTRLHIAGGSAGGYMALAMAAECFPVTSTTAEMPVVNLAYNLNYLEVNKGPSQYPQQSKATSPLPVLCAVTGLADLSYQVFGKDLSADTWYYLSPIAYLDRIACPTLIVCSTGDMLVPHSQMTRKYPRPIDAALFPEGYQRDFDALTLVDAARVAFDELVPAEDLFVHVEPVPADAPENPPPGAGPGKKPWAGPPFDRPWSPDKQWSLLILDEGPPLPHSSHMRHNWPSVPLSFLQSHQHIYSGAEILSPAKLDRLMERYVGHDDERVRVADGTPAIRVNFEELERLDVLTGLLDYADMGQAHTRRLKRLYRAGDCKPFGRWLTLRRVTRERDALLDTMDLAPAQGAGH